MREQNGIKKRVGLALSGGGYRAAAFHLGTLRALHKLGRLDEVDVMSTVSGGSIVGADYAFTPGSNGYPAFEKLFISKLKQSVIGRVLTSLTFILIVLCALIWMGIIAWFQFSTYPWASWIVLVVGLFILVKFQFSLFPVSRIIEGIYDRIFFSKKVLSQLPKSPIIAINSTNTETGRPFTFSRDRMSDSNYEHPGKGSPIKFNSGNFPVARAVMASSCVPFAFTPVGIGKSFFVDPKDMKRAHPALIDGGVYDNQGMHKLTFKSSGYRCDVVITSDAGNKMQPMSSYRNAIALLTRTVDLFMDRIKDFQIMDNIYQPGSSREREIAYISLGWDLDRCIPGFVKNLKKKNIPQQVVAAHKIPEQYLDPFNAEAIQEYLEQEVDYAGMVKRQQSKADLELARNVGTNLTSLSDKQINALINQAELMTELQVKLYCP